MGLRPRRQSPVADVQWDGDLLHLQRRKRAGDRGTDGATTYYDYDWNGNQTAKDGPDGTTYFHYDFDNLLRQIDLPDGAHNHFTCDADRKRGSAADSTGYIFSRWRLMTRSSGPSPSLAERLPDGTWRV